MNGMLVMGFGAHTDSDIAQSFSFHHEFEPTSMLCELSLSMMDENDDATGSASALYDAKTGRIHHSHTVHIHAGGRDVAEQEAIEGAYRHARRLGHDPARLKVKVSTNPEHGHFPHTIDMAAENL